MAEAAAGAGELVELDERRLLLRHRDGEPDAFAALVDRYRAPVYSYLTRCGVTGEDRDDLFQEIFIRVHRAAHSFEAERPLHPWLFTIVANVVRSHLRRQRVRQLVAAAPVEVDPVDEAPDGERAAAARQTLQWLEAEIATLSLARREVLILAAIERRPLKEVAEILGMPVNTVKTHLRRARMTLAERLAGHHRGEVRA